MKSYRITDSLSVVRYGNRLRLEVDGHVVDDVTDDDVARLIDMLVDAKSGHVDDYSSFSFADNDVKYAFAEYWPANKDTCADVRIGICESIDDERSEDVHLVRLTERWQWTKLADVLTHVLPRLCEEGV